jgi:hypothetical protein
VVCLAVFSLGANRFFSLHPILSGPQESGHILVTGSQSFHVGRPLIAPDFEDARASVDQHFYDLKAPSSRRPIQWRPALFVLLIDIDPPVDQLMNALQVIVLHGVD